MEIIQVSQLFVNTVQTHNKVSSHPIGVTSNHVVPSTGDTLLWAWNIRTSRKPSASWCRGAWLWHAECAEFLEKGTGPLASLKYFKSYLNLESNMNGPLGALKIIYLEICIKIYRI